MVPNSDQHCLSSLSSLQPLLILQHFHQIFIQTMRPRGQCIIQAPISMCLQELFKKHHISLTHFFLH
eukprot:Skav234355  [mRNA]  locus=scaffold1274:117552:118094:- [translate_table: standard]